MGLTVMSITISHSHTRNAHCANRMISIVIGKTRGKRAYGNRNGIRSVLRTYYIWFRFDQITFYEPNESKFNPFCPHSRIFYIENEYESELRRCWVSSTAVAERKNRSNRFSAPER